MKTKKKKTASKSSPNIVKASSAVVVVAALFFVVFAGVDHFSNRRDVATQENVTDINTANLGQKENTEIAEPEKTEDGKGESANHNTEKELAAAAEEANNKFEKTEDGKKVAHLMIDYVYQEDGYVYAAGETVDVVSRVGQCTYVFTSGDKTVSESVNVLPNPKNTGCEMLKLDKNRLSAGEWNLILKFNSEYAEGESEAISITIQ